MADFFLFLFFVSLAGLIAGLANPSLFTRIIKKELARRHVGLIFGGGVILFFVLFGITSDIKDAAVAEEQDQKEQQENGVDKEKQVVEIPSYEVLEKNEVPALWEFERPEVYKKGGYLGQILLNEDMLKVPPDEFEEIALAIMEKEDLVDETSFYITEAAYNYNALGPAHGNYEDMVEGLIGSISEGNFDTFSGSRYHELHYGSEELDKAPEPEPEPESKQDMGLNVSVQQQGELYDEPILAIENPTDKDWQSCSALLNGKYTSKFIALNGGTTQELPLSRESGSPTRFIDPAGVSFDLETETPQGVIIKCDYPNEEQTEQLPL